MLDEGALPKVNNDKMLPSLQLCKSTTKQPSIYMHARTTVSFREVSLPNRKRLTNKSMSRKKKTPQLVVLRALLQLRISSQRSPIRATHLPIPRKNCYVNLKTSPGSFHLRMRSGFVRAVSSGACFMIYRQPLVRKCIRCSLLFWDDAGPDSDASRHSARWPA